MSTIDWTLHKDYRIENDPKYPEMSPFKWPIYTWGNITIDDYCTVTWRGMDFMAELDENPLTGGICGNVEGSVVSLDPSMFDGSCEIGDPWAKIAWWATHPPGRLCSMEILPDGQIHASVWTGLLEIWEMDSHRRFINTPEILLAWRRGIELELVSTKFVSEKTIQIGPVGYVNELTLCQETGLGLDRDVWGSIADLL